MSASEDLEPPGCEDLSSEAKKHQLLEDVTHLRSVYRDWEHYSVCDSDSCSVVTRVRNIERIREPLGRE
jgi:hypothetical protein